VRLAQDLSLQVEETYISRDGIEDWRLRRRFNTWICKRRVSLLIEHPSSADHRLPRGGSSVSTRSRTNEVIDVSVSVRLGRNAMVSLTTEMSTRWWESIERTTREPSDATFPFPRARASFLENRAFAELTHVSHMKEQLS